MKLTSALALGITLFSAGIAQALPAQDPNAFNLPDNAAAPAAPTAMQPASTSKPLMVIRFNQPRVSFERALYTTLSQALEVKPDAMFDIVSVTPATSTSVYNQQKLKQLTQDNTGKVLSVLKEMGMPDERLSLTERTDGVEASEVRIYIR